jgi:ribosome-associated protein YbcJ (S4-like RNA binding protein)
MQEIFIKTEYITLGQFLKFTNIIEIGSLAKEYINENEIIVNNDVEKRRGRKLYDGYILVVNNTKYQIKNSKENENV